MSRAGESGSGQRRSGESDGERRRRGAVGQGRDRGERGAVFVKLG